MTQPPDDECGDVLRRVLRAEADAVVPSPEGLEIIRARIEQKGARGLFWWRAGAALASAVLVAGTIVMVVPSLRDEVTTRIRDVRSETSQPSSESTNRPPRGPSSIPRSEPAAPPVTAPKTPAEAEQTAESTRSTSKPTPTPTRTPTPTPCPSTAAPEDGAGDGAGNGTENGSGTCPTRTPSASPTPSETPPATPSCPAEECPAEESGPTLLNDAGVPSTMPG
jgi:cytoskeletal protein RodZ